MRTGTQSRYSQGRRDSAVRVISVPRPVARPATSSVTSPSRQCGSVWDVGVAPEVAAVAGAVLVSAGVRGDDASSPPSHASERAATTRKAPNHHRITGLHRPVYM